MENDIKQLKKDIDDISKDNLAEISRKNIYIIIVSMVVLMIMAGVKYGLSKQTGLAIVIVLVLGGAIIIYNRLMKDDEKNAIGLLIMGGLATCIYSIVMGGSSSAFIVCYVMLALSAMYFNVRITLYTGVTMCVVLLILAFAYPIAIDGPEGTIVSAVPKVIMYGVTIVILRLVIIQGEEINKKSMENVLSLKETIEKTDNIAKELNDTVIDSNNAVVQIVGQSGNIGSSTNDINKDVEDITNGILNVNHSISVVRKYITKDTNLSKELSDRYVDVVNTVREGIDKIDVTKETMIKMEQAITNAFNITHTLEKHMVEIDSILEEIDNITSQTKLLALNASIEAARTGESGKGFAVVADEIRALSSESSIASSNIKKIIETLNVTVFDVSDKMKDSSKVSKRGYKEMDSITDILERIDNTSEIVEDVIDKENKLINNIGAEFNRIADEMTGLFGLSEKNMGMLNNIQKNIDEQNEAIHTLQSKMDYVGKLASDISLGQ